MEVWKDIPNYEGYYQVSNLGNVKSLERFIVCGKNESAKRKIPETILKPSINNVGYYSLKLQKFGVKKTIEIHKLVSICFLGHIANGYKLVVDHINNNRLDNRSENLQLITQRENTSKDKKNCSSKYTGVCWHILNNRWRASITINNKPKHLGYFKNEIDAHNAYQNALKELLNESK